MDIKLKNYKFSVWFKLLAVLLCIAGMLTLAYGLLKAPYFEYAVRNKSFSDSFTGRELCSSLYYNISRSVFVYKSEEYIKSGKAMQENELFGRKSYLLNEKARRINVAEENYKSAVDNIFNQNTSDTASDSEKNPAEVNDPEIILNDLKSQKSEEIQQINEEYDAKLKEIEKAYINEQLRDYYSRSDSLKKAFGMYYTVLQNGTAVSSNVEEASVKNTAAGITGACNSFFKALPVYIILEGDNDLSNHFPEIYNYEGSNIPANTTVYIGISQERYKQEEITFKRNFDEGLLGIKLSAAGLLAFLTGLVYLVYSAGRRTNIAGVHYMAIDIIYADIALAVTAAANFLCLILIYEFFENYRQIKSSINLPLVYTVFGLIIAVGTLMIITFITMLAKRIKRHELIKHTLIYKIFAWSIRKVKNIYIKIRASLNEVFDRSPFAIRLILIFGAFSFIVLICSLLFLADEAGILFGFMGLVAVNAAAVYFILKHFKFFKDIKTGAERIRAGELSFEIPQNGINEFRQLARSINQIADGMKNAVGSQVRAERMKAELITNVSHDLKTPLTSIITYVDLLKKEGLQSENSDKYLEIIDSKTQRLKSLTEDLFEAAKASSGNIEINLKKLNICSLISQGLGELSDKIENSGLQFKTNMPAEGIYVNADGKLLWRVVENLMSNVFKYALPNSRVYIDITEKANNANITIKNISAYELNIAEEELMERFKRGDASRHSEGSGLGLSIAKSLTELQGGSFTLSIDGDLFKASIVLPSVSE